MKTLLCLNSSSDSTFPSLEDLQKAASGLEVICVEGRSAAHFLLQTNPDIVLFLTTELDPSLLIKRNKFVPVLLFSSLSFSKIASIYHGCNFPFLLHIVPSVHPYSAFLLPSLQKLLSRTELDLQLISLQKMELASFVLTETNQDHICNEIEKLSDSILLSRFKSKIQAAIAEEFIMNATKNARPIYQIKNQTQPPKISLTCRYNSEVFLLSIQDPFGSLSPYVFLEYAMKQPDKNGGHFIELKANGAGLGFYKIIHSCHGLIGCVRENVQTEITAIFFLRHPLLKTEKQPRILQCFSYK